MKLKPMDLHLIFDDTANRLKIFNHNGEEIFRCEAQNSTVNRGFLKHGRCPRGEFVIGKPLTLQKEAFGYYFTPLYDRRLKGPMSLFKRAGIGLHGGGTGLLHPWAPRQGWQKTHGCIRLQNEDNASMVRHIRVAHFAGGVCYLDVVGEPE